MFNKITTIRIIFLIVLFQSCNFSSYQIIRESKLPKSNLSLKKYYVFPENFVDNSIFITEAYKHLASNNTQSLNKLLVKSNNKKDDNYYLIKAFYHFKKGEFDQADSCLNKIDSSNSNYLINLLHADILYENDKLDDTISYKQHYKNYQYTYDNYVTNDTIRDIIKLRTRQLKYTYW